MAKKVKANKTQTYLDNYNTFDSNYRISVRGLRLSKQSATYKRYRTGELVVNLNLKPLGDYNTTYQNFDVSPIEFCKILPYFNFKPIATLNILLNIAISDNIAFKYVQDNYNDLLFDIYEKVYNKIESSNGKKYINDTGYITVDIEDARHMMNTLNMVLL